MRHRMDSVLPSPQAAAEIREAVIRRVKFDTLCIVLDRQRQYRKAAVDEICR